MNIDRRKFLIVSGGAGLGLIVAGKLSWNNSSSSEIANAKSITKPLLRFGVLADTGTGSTQQYAVAHTLLKQHQKSPLDLVLLAGDNIYTNGEFSKIESVFTLPYQDLLKNDVKFYACLGNHDVLSDVKNGDKISNQQVDYPNFHMQGKRYYTFRKGDVQFFGTETNSLINPKDSSRIEQIAWLDRELGKSTAKIKIVFGHHPPYSAGLYGINNLLIKDISSILTKHKVPLWINGHDHSYQRSKPIDGVTYLTSGGGGAPLHPLFFHQDWLDFAKSIHSCATVDVYAHQLVITGIDLDANVIDRATISIAKHGIEQVG